MEPFPGPGRTTARPRARWTSRRGSARIALSLVCFGLYLAASPAGFAQGTFEINQAAALAGNVTGTGLDLPGYPVILDVPGSYRLTGPLVVPAGESALVTMASDISIDLAGFPIDGSGASDALILASDANVRVFDGSVLRSGAAGLVLGEGARVARVHSAGHAGVGIQAGSDADVSSCRAVDNAADGISLGDDSRVSGSMVFDNQGVGVAFAARGVLLGSNLARNGLGSFAGGIDLGHSLCEGSTDCVAGCRPEVCDGQDNDCDGEIDEEASDCSDFFEDVDGDGFGTANTSCECGPVAPFTASVAGDCFDGNADARPGQTVGFGADRGDGSFDYDCDGAETPQELALGACGVSPGCSFNQQAGWDAASAPACGVDEVFLTSCRLGSFLMCTRVTEQRTQACL